MEGKPAVHISAAAGAIASSQETLACTALEQADTQPSSPAAAQQLSTVTVVTPDRQAPTETASEPHTPAHSASVVRSVQVAAPSKPDMEAGSCSSVQESLDSVHILKPLTPAQSSEHSLGSGTEEHRSQLPASEAAAAGAAGSASAPDQAALLSCEVCNISTTSPELLQQHLQGRRHLKVLAVQNPASDADRYYALPRLQPWHLSCTASSHK